MNLESKGLLAGVDESRLKQRLKTAPYRNLWEALTHHWKLMAERSAAANGYYHYGSLAWNSISPGVIEAALACRFSGDADALAYVEGRIEHLVRMIDNPDEELRRLASNASLPSHSHSELALAADLCRGSISQPQLTEFLRVCRGTLIDFNAGTRPLLYFSSGQNISLTKTINAGVVALVWGEESGHHEWKAVVDLARDACVLFLRNGIDAGGYGYEGTGYSHETLYHVYLYAQLLLQAGRENLFETEPALRRIPEASLSMLFPDRNVLVNTNDHGLVLPWSMPWLLLTSRHYGRPLDLSLWYEFQGPDHPRRPFGYEMPWYERTYHTDEAQQCHIPTHALTLLWWDPDVVPLPINEVGAPTANYSAGVEIANFRTSWSTGAVYLNVPGGGRTHAAAGHAHADCGHFSIFAYDEYLAIDTGRYNADEDQHNVMLIEGKCHMPNAGWGYNLRKGHLRGFQRHPMLDYIAADSAHIKDCIWADRHILFVRMDKHMLDAPAVSSGKTGKADDDAYIVTIDNINADNKKHTYWWQLHASASNHIRITGKHAASVEARRARLDIHFVPPAALDYPKDPHQLKLRIDEKEWGYGSPPPISAMKTGEMISSARHPRLIGELTGLNGLLMTIMIPRCSGQPPLVVRQIPETRIMRAEVQWGDYTDTILAALDHGYIRLPDVEGISQLAVIRRDQHGQVQSVWTLEGNTLTVR